MNSYLNGTIVLARANEEVVFSALLIYNPLKTNHKNEVLNKPLFLFLISVFLFLIGTSSFADTEKQQRAVDSLAQKLPKRLMTIVDKTLDDQFAEIERSLSELPEISRKEVFLITLPLENYIEDIYFPANRPAVIYPRTIFLILYEEINKENSKKKIAQHLVELQQRNEFEKITRRKAKKDE